MANPVDEEINLAQPSKENTTRSSQAGFQSSVKNNYLIWLRRCNFPEKFLHWKWRNLMVIRIQTRVKFMHSFDLIVNAVNLSNCKNVIVFGTIMQRRGQTGNRILLFVGSR